ncbi:MAG: type 1 glutamine amidotransferase domain-containing protein, partial [Deltaproteobacteria bacterium]
PEMAFAAAGNTLTNRGIRVGSIWGDKGNVEASVDKLAKDANPAEYDALFIPGGLSPDHLRVDPAAVRFARYFMDKNKPVFAICHGPQVLITAQALKGRKATGYPSITQDIINAGAEYIDNELVVDGNLVTSRYPEDIAAFIEGSLEQLLKTELKVTQK